MLKVITELAKTTSVAVSLVWVQVLEGDNRQSVQFAIDQINQPDWRHFYDPEQIAAREMAAELGGRGNFAWDTYLVFSPEAEWTSAPPRPMDWVHQLDHADWAPAQRRKTGTAMYEALKSMIQNA